MEVPIPAAADLLKAIKTNPIVGAIFTFEVALEATLWPPDPGEPVPSVPPSDKPTAPPPLRGPEGGLRRHPKLCSIIDRTGFTLRRAKLTILDNFYSIAIETLKQGKEKEKI